jgi:hypothetical protein
MSEARVEAHSVSKGTRWLRLVGRAYGLLGQAYFGIGTVLVAVRVVVALTTQRPPNPGGWALDWVLYFFFWPMLVYRFGLTGPLDSGANL